MPQVIEQSLFLFFVFSNDAFRGEKEEEQLAPNAHTGDSTKKILRGRRRSEREAGNVFLARTL